MNRTAIPNPLRSLSRLSAAERLKALLLSSWFFLCVTTLWLLKPIRTASVLSHLGAAELPYLRFGSVIGVGVVVMAYSHVVNRLSRLELVRGASSLFALVFVIFWLALRVGGEALGAQRWFVWAIFILVDIYSTVMVAIFWTYTNDVVSRLEADKLYGPIGFGGILGGVAGGAGVDSLVSSIGPVDLLLVCSGLVAVGALFGGVLERRLKPAPRAVVAPERRLGAGAFEGARAVLRNRYLLWIVGIVVAYEIAAALNEFVISVVFERTYKGELEIAKMYGRLGWIVSATALVSQLVLVPLLLPFKRTALLIPPLAMAAATLGLTLLTIVPFAILLAASDRGLNYSLQQVTKETLYVPLSDVERYKAKAFIDILVDRGAKALSSIVLLIIIATLGLSLRACLTVALVALAAWAFCSNALGQAYAAESARASAESEPDEPSVACSACATEALPVPLQSSQSR